MIIFICEYGSPETDDSSSGCPAKSTCGVEMSDETDQGRKAGRIKYKKSGLFSKEGFCQRMTESFFFCCIAKKIRKNETGLVQNI